MDGIIIGSSPAEGAIDFYYDLIQHYCLTPRSLPRRVLIVGEVKSANGVFGWVTSLS